MASEKTHTSKKIQGTKENHDEVHTPVESSSEISHQQQTPVDVGCQPPSGHPTALPLPEKIAYEFAGSLRLFGMLTSQCGAFIDEIKIESGASLLIKEHGQGLKIGRLEGTPTQIKPIKATLVVMNGKFPLWWSRFPHKSILPILL